ncbi:serine phosphatase RsbU, regulator of sigma subunit [Desulfocurvibacter africanus PCS]|uniref:Serine phosphatase RsbU, regulator of sigma subunit n=1 Tax=Desulfocurvibacter africanus PCS TaxID=1262666 RepID=M5Q227_DESAF|nr:SpoIIE family protein phosphatase [Desulfocurvibacter africanus]EMG38086.1 serine phosphatase RsbU, regulator of sigma subunit [Desulfocurvibacter africanus PCS]
MRIRWKLLLLFLAIFLLPIGAGRYIAERSWLRLGLELGERSRDELVRRTGAELGRMVEDHARILARDRAILEALVRVQALEAARLLGAPPPGAPGDILVAEPLHMGSEGKDAAMDPRFCRVEEQVENCLPLEVDFDRSAVRYLGQMGQMGNMGQPGPAERADAARLASLAPVHVEASRKQPSPLLWQLIVLRNGTMTIYPALGGLPAMWDPRKSEWYARALKADSVLWTGPVTDPLTRQPTLVASLAVPGLDGAPAGVAAMVVPAASLVHENEHITGISHEASSFVVRPEAQPKAEAESEAGVGAVDRTKSKPRLHVLAGEDSQPMPERVHMLWLTRQPRFVESEDDAGLRTVAEDMRAMRSGVRVLPFDGRKSLWTYGPVSGEGLALLLIVPMADVIAPAAAAEQYVLEQVRHQINITGLVILAGAGIVTLAAFLASGWITANISKLVGMTRRLSQGDFEARVDIRTHDELRELGESFNAMVPALQERLAIKESLDLAREIQRNLLPAEAPHAPGLEVAGASHSCEETGGDYYDYLDGCCEGRGLAVCVGDVSGHGLPAALFMASARAFLRAQAGSSTSLAEAVSRVNRLIYHDTYRTGHFMTLLLMEFDRDGVSWVRAGHDPALVYDPVADSFDELSGPGLALGLMPDYQYSQERRADLRPGLLFCLATDGVWEARSPQGEFYGKERLRSCIRANASRPADEIVEAVAEDVAVFRGRCPTEDDVTLVIVRIRADR